jgi:hypothetical protein
MIDIWPKKRCFKYTVANLCGYNPAQLILIHLMNLVTSGEECELWNSSLCTFPHLPVSSSPSSKCFSEHFVFKHSQSVYVPQETEFHTHWEKCMKLVFCNLIFIFSGDSKVQDSEPNGSFHICIPPLSWPSYACFQRRCPTEIVNACFVYPMSIWSYIAL